MDLKKRFVAKNKTRNQDDASEVRHSNCFFAFLVQKKKDLFFLRKYKR